MTAVVPATWEVRAARPEAPDVVTIDLAPLDGAAPPFLPAQVNMLCLPGIGEVPISVSSDPASPAVQSHTIRASGPVTRALCALRPGDTVGVRGPFGTSWGCEAAEGRDMVLVAGGIGMAPLRSAVLAIVRRRHRYGAVRLLVGARSPVDVLYREDLRTWVDAGVEVRVTVDHADAGWTGPTGLVTALLADAPLRPERTTVLACGPDRMMQATAELAVTHGVAAGDIRLTLERTMRCGVGLCGHCQLGPVLICRDGPVVTYDRIASFYDVAEV